MTTREDMARRLPIANRWAYSETTYNEMLAFALSERQRAFAEAAKIVRGELVLGRYRKWHSAGTLSVESPEAVLCAALADAIEAMAEKEG